MDPWIPGMFVPCRLLSKVSHTAAHIHLASEKISDRYLISLQKIFNIVKVPLIDVIALISIYSFLQTHNWYWSVLVGSGRYSVFRSAKRRPIAAHCFAIKSTSAPKSRDHWDCCSKLFVSPAEKSKNWKIEAPRWSRNREVSWRRVKTTGEYWWILLFMGDITWYWLRFIWDIQHEFYGLWGSLWFLWFMINNYLDYS